MMKYHLEARVDDVERFSSASRSTVVWRSIYQTRDRLQPSHASPTDIPECNRTPYNDWYSIFPHFVDVTSRPVTANKIIHDELANCFWNNPWTVNLLYLHLSLRLEQRDFRKQNQLVACSWMMVPASRRRESRRLCKIHPFFVSFTRREINWTCSLIQE